MNMISATAAADAAAPIPLGSEADTAAAILSAAELLFPYLERGQRIDAPGLRHAMETAFGGSDASGVWTWKTAYEA